MKKIYFLINSLEGGWAERVIHNLSAKLRDDHDVTIITLKDRHFYDRLDGVRYVSLSSVTSDATMFILIPWYAWKLRRLLRAEQYDGGVSFLEIANFVHILSRKDAVISFRTNMSVFNGAIGYIKGLLYKILIGRLYPHARYIVVNSEENKQDLRKYLGVLKWAPCIEAIYNPIDIARVEKWRQTDISMEISAWLKDKCVFITVGRLVELKHHDKILRALALLPNRINIALLVIGDGPERERLMLLAQSLWLSDTVLFLGEKRDVFPYLVRSDYFVYASEVEGFPNVLIEALACGLPIITSAFHTGAREVIFGSYRDDIEDVFPAYWPNWVMIDIADFEGQFWQVYSAIGQIECRRQGLEKFMPETIVEQWRHVL